MNIFSGLHQHWMRATRKGKAIISILAIYISMTGLVTFSLFILEESIQTAMFGTWPAQDAKDWEVVKFGLERIKETTHALKVVNYSLGWIQPLAFVAYKAYAEAGEVYVAGLRAKIFANAPELFAGETIPFSFTPLSVTQTPENLFAHRNHNVVLISSVRYGELKRIQTQGLVSLQGNQVIVRESPR